MKKSLPALMLTILLVGLSTLAIDIQLAKAEPLHDIAITDVMLYNVIVFEGFCTHIDVTVENQGDFTETFNVTVYANTSAIYTWADVSLSNRSAAILGLTWHTVGWAKGNYTISSTADTVLGENNTDDNTLVDGWLFMTLAGDFDGDRDVDIFDIVTFAGWYLKPPPIIFFYNPDIDCDGTVDIFDIVRIVANYGKSW